MAQAANMNGHDAGDGSGDASNASSNASSTRHVQPAKPLLTRLLYGTAVYTMQSLVIGPAMTIRGLNKWLFPPETRPTLVKTYNCRPHLPVRIFFPKSYDRASPRPRPLPLLLSIHGGGFVVGDPSDNDLWNSTFCNTHSALVVALNYAKAPANPYPGPRLDLEAQIAAVFDDAALAPHLDKAKVGITGFSAGGSLTLTVSQVPAVREKITAGIVPIYPVTDLSVAPDKKAQTRRYKPALGGARGRPKDPLLALGPVFNWSYIPVGQDLCDPMLSAFFADRSSFPRRVWLVGCELDMLGHEAWRAACKWAGRAVPGLDQRIGQEEPAEGGKLGVLITQGDQRFAWEEKNRDGEIKWLCVPDAGHGFDMPGALGADEKDTEDGGLKRDALIKMTGEWLFGSPQGLV